MSSTSNETTLEREIPTGMTGEKTTEVEELDEDTSSPSSTIINTRLSPADTTTAPPEQSDYLQANELEVILTNAARIAEILNAETYNRIIHMFQGQQQQNSGGHQSFLITVADEVHPTVSASVDGIISDTTEIEEVLSEKLSSCHVCMVAKRQSVSGGVSFFLLFYEIVMAPVVAAAALVDACALLAREFDDVFPEIVDAGGASSRSNGHVGGDEEASAGDEYRPRRSGVRRKNGRTGASVR